MRRCPTCKRAFDDTLSVCPDDGGALVGGEEPATQGYGGLGGKATWNPTQDQLAEIQQTVAAITKLKRNRWPWVIVAIVVLFLIGLIGAIVVRKL